MKFITFSEYSKIINFCFKEKYKYNHYTGLYIIVLNSIQFLTVKNSHSIYEVVLRKKRFKSLSVSLVFNYFPVT